ncbi:hypothetical protein [uncultured Gilvimarinus sp.]|uniref:hypothetical protein n=1 Tax=uncultured Gilvimarinus sp. TaxID=1689143 RepID=UPI0030DD705A
MRPQHLDIDGSALLVGDTVVVVGPNCWLTGQKLTIMALKPSGSVAFTDRKETPGHHWVTASPHTELRKINPKPELTTWDNCVFQPEGITQ